MADSRRSNPVLEKSVEFAIKIVRLVDSFPKTPAGFGLGGQLVRSGTSIGANIQESQRARSKLDFKNCLEIAPKEASETKYWLFLVKNLDLYDIDGDLFEELEEIIKLLAAITKKLKDGLIKIPHS